MRKYFFVVAVVAILFAFKIAHAELDKPTEQLDGTVTSCEQPGDTQGGEPAACNLVAKSDVFKQERHASTNPKKHNQIVWDALHLNEGKKSGTSGTGSADKAE
jgi:hypothetical protein